MTCCQRSGRDPVTKTPKPANHGLKWDNEIYEYWASLLLGLDGIRCETGANWQTPLAWAVQTVWFRS